MIPKFRAWDEKEKKMHVMKEGFGFCVTFDGKVASWDEGQGWDETYTKDFILMQSIGLKDKNGKEIYDGDILRGKAMGYSGSFLCKFKDSAWALEFSYRGLKDIAHPIYGEEMEIIGNIHENPELLEVDDAR